ncbi:lipid-A-disaccharide synthase [Klebsiella pneumoniae]|uniref:Lipid-A-disaccharide synthase n=1 Tax=Klebsiella pneumoniae TaxID=573 RepID=A0A377XQL6_KLEPN|nr:lipid-A-disaccharide synthase [Klebsiella pneumoniae]
MIVHMLDGQARDAMIASDAALLASGTAALECMLAKCPMVVGYRMKPFTFWLAKAVGKNRLRLVTEPAGRSRTG